VTGLQVDRYFLYWCYSSPLWLSIREGGWFGFFVADDLKLLSVLGVFAPSALELQGLFSLGVNEVADDGN
jgi:hypothetical protein